MKIMICGSMYFAKDMLRTKGDLERLGHDVMIPDDTHECIENPELNMDINYCMNLNIDKKCFNKVAKSDAILVLNHPKDDIKGYIGGATLMEIGLARHLDKKIFLLHELPTEKDLKYALEVKLTKPIIIKGNLEKVI